MRASADSTASSRAPAPDSATSPVTAARRASWRFVLGLVTTMIVAPCLVEAAFSAHEPHCVYEESFWNGDRPTGDGDVEGVILGSSRMGFGIDLLQLRDDTSYVWQRVARHAIVTASVPASYPWMLASTRASPGMRVLVLEVSPLMMDTTSCGRASLSNLPVRPHWWGPARKALGPDAALAPAVAMGWLPHRWLMTSGRRHDIVAHLRAPGHALRVLADLPEARDGFGPPARWRGPDAPDLEDARIRSRRAFLLGGPLDTFVPHPSATCLAIVRDTLAMAGAEQSLLVMPPLRARMRDSLPASYLAELRAAVQSLADTAPSPTQFIDATDRFADAEEVSFTDFDHLSADGAARWTREVAAILRGGS